MGQSRNKLPKEHGAENIIESINMMVVRIPVSQSFLEFLGCQEGITMSEFCITEWYLRGWVPNCPSAELIICNLTFDGNGSGMDQSTVTMNVNPQELKDYFHE